jgi:hypothetical protein
MSLKLWRDRAASESEPSFATFTSGAEPIGKTQVPDIVDEKHSFATFASFATDFQETYLKEDSGEAGGVAHGGEKVFSRESLIFNGKSGKSGKTALFGSNSNDLTFASARVPAGKSWQNWQKCRAIVGKEAGAPPALPPLATLLAAMPATPGPYLGLRAGEWPPIRQRALEFLREWEEEATALGWTDVDLLGVHPRVGTLNPDYVGALLSSDSPVVSITADVITYKDGNRFLRDLPSKAIPVWEFAALNTKEADHAA